MRRLILVAVLGLVAADTQAFGGRLRGRVFARPSGGCAQAAAPVRTAVGGTLQHVGGLAVDAGNTVRTVYRPTADVPTCADGYCPIPSPNLPTR